MPTCGFATQIFLERNICCWEQFVLLGSFALKGEGESDGEALELGDWKNPNNMVRVPLA